MSTRVPPLLQRLVDDAAVFPPGNSPLVDAVAGHRRHRAAWYAPMLGPLLVPAAAAADLGALLEPGEQVDVGLVGTPEALPDALDALPAGALLRQVEGPVAKRGEDPLPGLRRLLALAGRGTVYAEIPLSHGLHDALDAVAAARGTGAPVAPKFRTGGLAAELFPSPTELAAVICACRDRALPFKLTAGLHRGVRYTDQSTGLTHHGFLNVLFATVRAADGADRDEVADVLALTTVEPLAGQVRYRLADERPLWIAFGTCSIAEPLGDLVELDLLAARPEPGVTV